MTSPSRSDHTRRIVGFLESNGATGVIVDVSRKHPRICFDYAGARHALVTAATPSDGRRSAANAIAMARRMMRGER